MFLSKHKNSFFYVYYKDVDGKRKKVSKKAKLKSGTDEFLSKFQEELKLREEKKSLPIRLSEFKGEILSHSGSVHSPKTTKNYRTTFNAMMEHFGEVQVASQRGTVFVFLKRWY
jgi:hypothetical protein